ncbi:universal stress protein [Rhodococcus sp. NPDC059968]|uniref:universal stress protein n=1 Tax=Rhodococcus sp. NPDC059968 TaxID=3347017 RepID=UPI00366F2979
MSVVDRRHIVVAIGVDGSSAATQAARWAAVVAAHRRSVPLHLVHVVQLPTVASRTKPRPEPFVPTANGSSRMRFRS